FSRDWSSDVCSSDLFQRGGKWHLYRAAKLHLRFAEAANRDGHHKLAAAFLNGSIGSAYDDPSVTDKTDVMQTHLPFPYDFDARKIGRASCRKRVRVA